MIVSVSLPLSILFAFIVLYFTGEAINSITLGGIALVLGLLVDNSIVTLENIDRHLRMGKSSWQASLDAALEVATPVLSSTLVIIVVFLPVMFLSGIAKYLFSPLAITVAGAMIGSYIFSLTLVPLAASWLFKDRIPESGTREEKLTFFQRIIVQLRNRYERSLKKALEMKRTILAATVLLFLGSLLILFNLGYELFPKSDVGQMEIQVRMESGTPLDIAQSKIVQMEQVVRNEIGSDLEQIISNIGVFYDLPAAYTPNSGTQDAFIGVQLKQGHHVSTFDYATKIRPRLETMFPGVEFSFNTGGLITAALNEGKPSPIDVQVKGNDLLVLHEIAERIRDTISTVPGTEDVRILQRIDQPAKNIDVDRIKASELGVKTGRCDKKIWCRH